MKQSEVVNIIKEEIENINGFEFEISWHDYHHGQEDGTAKISKDGHLLAIADITNYEQKIYIKYIEAKIKGQGYGQKLMEYMAKEFGYENLERGALTGDGVKLRQKLDKKFDFNYADYKESQSKHLNPDIIKQVKHRIVRQFLTDMVANGYEQTWKKWLAKKDFKELWKEYDFNDISEISTWMKGSVTNDHDNDEEPNKYILDDLKQILTK